MRNLKENRKRKAMYAKVAVAILLLFIGFSVVYVNDYYRADEDAIAEFSEGMDVTRKVLEDNMIIYGSEDAENGLIFYPGGKVEYTAYEPLMKSLAAEGVTCILVQMPFNLAVLDVDAAQGIQELYPQIKNWYIGGHSLGGSMAAAYLVENMNDFKGMVLLGSYTTVDLSEKGMKVVSVYGSEDNVMNYEKYLEYKSNLPKDCVEVVIDGGCHAYFGMYGAQDGDGIPSISNEEQIALTTEAIVTMMKNR